MKGEWRCVFTGGGAPSATTVGTQEMLKSSVDN